MRACEAPQLPRQRVVPQELLPAQQRPSYAQHAQARARCLLLLHVAGQALLLLQQAQLLPVPARALKKGHHAAQLPVRLLLLLVLQPRLLLLLGGTVTPFPPREGAIPAAHPTV